MKLKRVLFFSMIFFAICPNLVGYASDNAPLIYLNDEAISFQVPPIIENNTTLVQFRPLFEKLGFQIDWNEEKKTIIGTLKSLTIELTIGKSSALVNGNPVPLLVAPKIVSGYTLVPLRFVSESTGKLVDWHKDTGTVYISTVVENTPVLLNETVPELESKTEPKLDSITEKIDVVKLDPNIAYGKVVDSKGNPIPGASVHIFERSADGHKEETATDINGMYVFVQPLVKGKQYVLLAYPPASSALLGSTPTSFIYESAKLNDTSLNEVALKGKVVDESGKPLKGVEVDLYFFIDKMQISSNKTQEDYFNAHQMEVTDDQGSYRFGGLIEAEKYDIHALAPKDYMSLPETVITFHHDLHTVPDVVLHPADVYGQVLNEKGEALSMLELEDKSRYTFSIQLKSVIGSFSDTTQVVPNTNYYNFKGLTEGTTYQLQVLLDPIYIGPFYQSTPVTFIYKKNEFLLPDLKVLTSNPIKSTGQIIGVNDKGIANISIDLRARSNEDHSQRPTVNTDTKGNYSFYGLKDGEDYFVDVFSMGRLDDMIFKSIEGINYCMPETTRFTYNASSNKLPDIALKPLQMMGKVIDENGKAFGNVHIIIKDDGGALISPLRLSSAADGSFPICGLYPGKKYQLVVGGFLYTSTPSNDKTMKPINYDFVYDPAMVLPDFKVVYTTITLPNAPSSIP